MRQTKPQPSAGAMKAGSACADYVQAVLDNKKLNRGSDALAEIIDRETDAPLLLSALRSILLTIGPLPETKEEKSTVSIASQAIAKATREEE